MSNLLLETLECVARSGHSPSDVTFIGSRDAEYRCTWTEFETLADAEYDEGFGAAHVATDLYIRFSDGTAMWRGEYDGSEWWEYDGAGNTDYTKLGKPIAALVGDHLWDTVADYQPAAEAGVKTGEAQ